MAQHSEDSDTFRTSTEKLNFQLAQPKFAPLMVSDTAKASESMTNGETSKPEKSYLETEIDSYSGVDFKNRNSFPSSIRPPTPPKPATRAFTFGSTNPFTVLGSDSTGTNNVLYTTVSKPKTRPNVPPKPSLKVIKARTKDLRNHSTHSSSKSLMNSPENSKISTIACDENAIHRVKSLPNLEDQTGQTSYTQKHVLDVQRHSTIGYGMIGRLRSNGAPPKPLHMSHGSNPADYCDMIPESPPYINELPNHSENVYEDVKISSPKQGHQGRPLQFVSDVLDKKGTSCEMSPISDVSFTFENYAIYENLPAFRPSSRVGVYGSEDNDALHKVFEPPLQFSTNEFGYPNIPDSSRTSENYDYYSADSSDVKCGTTSPRLSELSPSSSFTDHGSSIASTAASSFQGVQVCHFPPQPPQGFYGDINTCGLPSEKPMGPGSVSSFSSASSTTSRRSRSRIPVPVKSRTPESYSHSQLKVPEEPAPPLPSTPLPSPAPIPKNKKKGNKADIKLSPPTPPSGKGARWYEMLGCIQTDTTQYSEPYGTPGERKRSKSLSKEHRRSKFFVPVEPNDAPPVTSGSTNNTANANYQNVP